MYDAIYLQYFKILFLKRRRRGKVAEILGLTRRQNQILLAKRICTRLK